MKKTGIERIAAERLRQVTAEKFDAQHDQEHKKNELAWAAVCFAAPDRVYTKKDFATSIAFDDPWPWEAQWDKRPRPSQGNFPEPEKATKKQRIDLLTKAGALIAAEIDRLQAQP